MSVENNQYVPKTFQDIRRESRLTYQKEIIFPLIIMAFEHGRSAILHILLHIYRILKKCNAVQLQIGRMWRYLLLFWYFFFRFLFAHLFITNYQFHWALFYTNNLFKLITVLWSHIQRDDKLIEINANKLNSRSSVMIGMDSEICWCS